MAINVTKPAINLREKLNEVTLETGIKGEELLNSDTSTEARNVLELDTHLFTDFESTGIDDNATSTKLTISDTTITGAGAFTSTSIDATKLSGNLPAIDGSALTGVGGGFDSGVKMVFAQAAAPTGWTQDTSSNDAALRVVSGSGGGTGGTHAFSSPPSTAHTHTGPSHTHSTPSHSHSHSLSAGAHTLSTSQMPSHNHSYKAGQTGSGGPFYSSSDYKGSNYTLYTYNSGSSSSHNHSLSGSITSGGSGTSGSGGTGATGSAGPTAFAPQYVDVIVCSKD